MQPTRTLQQILAESNSVYDPQVASLQKQIGDLPGQTAAEEAGLQAKQNDAFNEIVNGARRRGLGFSGIPLGEQAQYTASTYLPAVAQLHTAQNQQATSLSDAISQIREQQFNNAQSVYQAEQDRALQAKQAADQAAAYKNLFNQQSQQAAAPAAQNPLTLKGATLKDQAKGGAGGYNFSFGGQPISAVGFAQVNSVNPADILYTMAQSGDSYAANAYRDIVSNGGQITPDIAKKYQALFWGTNLIPAAPKPKPTVKQMATDNLKRSTGSIFTSPSWVGGFLR